MVLSKEDFLSAIKSKVGDDVSDETMKFIEDMTDTYDSLSKPKDTDGEDWKAKYDELDKTWRDKYKARFFESTISQSEPTDVQGVQNDTKTDADNSAENVTYEDLFTESEG